MVNGKWLMVQRFKGSMFKGSRVQMFKGSNVQGFNRSNVQGFKCSTSIRVTGSNAWLSRF